MTIRLTESKTKAKNDPHARHVADIPAPERGAKVWYDGDPPGFGLRITAATEKHPAGVRSFILEYRVQGSGTRRRKTIGQFPTWTVTAARKEAAALRKLVDKGEDPLGDIHAKRTAPTVADLADYYRENHLPTKAAKSQREDEDMLRMFILPALGKLKVAEVRRPDIARLHRKLKDRPYRANRVKTLISKMFNLALDPEDIAWRPEQLGNPASRIKPYPEEERDRYLSPAEIERLTEALRTWPDQKIANAIRLLLLTGARKGEVLGATWAMFDLERGVWTKPSAHVKQKRKHIVPLSAPALQLLSQIKAESEPESESEFVFQSDRRPGQPLEDVQNAWPKIMKEARIENFRPHDLRHTYASILASANLSLPLIGALLGHTRAETTRRYAHLQDDALRAATDRVGAIVEAAGKPAAEVISIRRK